MGKDVSSILHTCFFVYESLLGFFCTEAIMRQKKKKHGQVLNKAPFCKSRQIYIYILLDGLVGSSVGFFLGGGGRGASPQGESKYKRQDKISHDSTR